MHQASKRSKRSPGKRSATRDFVLSHPRMLLRSCELLAAARRANHATSIAVTRLDRRKPCAFENEFS
jgi:hypothetical protein